MAEKQHAEWRQAKAACQMLQRAGILARPPVQAPFCKWARPPWPVALAPAQPAIFTRAQLPYPICPTPTSIKPIGPPAEPPAQPPAPPAKCRAQAAATLQPVSKSALLLTEWWASKAVERKARPPAKKAVTMKAIKDSNEDVAVGVGKRNKVEKQATKAIKDSSEDVAPAAATTRMYGY